MKTVAPMFRRQAGISYIEVLIAVLIIVITLVPMMVLMLPRIDA